MIGTYNALVINSKSHLTDSSNLKRLDGMFAAQDRSPAVTTQWTKLSNPIENQVEMNPITTIAKIETSEVVEKPSEATIQELLDLKLVEVINTKKWNKGVKSSEFSGAIATNNGIIESLNASLPEGMKIDIAFSDMTGNTFEYDLNGEVYKGIMYQVDQGSYMVTMTNGPLEGTRLRFAGEAAESKEQTQAYLAQTHNVEVGTFGEESEPAQLEIYEGASNQTAEGASFNFNL